MHSNRITLFDLNLVDFGQDPQSSYIWWHLVADIHLSLVTPTPTTGDILAPNGGKKATA